MVFSSFLFLFIFLPAVLASYYLTPWRFRNLVLLAFSYLFYAWGAPSVLPVLIGGSLLDYFLGRAISRSSSERRQRIILSSGVLMNLASLAYYKYMGFFIEQVNSTLVAVGVQPFTLLSIALPIGISFFTFQKISYLVDIYRGTTPPAVSLIDYLLYVALFPQLIAGPIIRYHDIAQQFRARTHSLQIFHSGVNRFCLGLGKKILIADQMGAVTDNIFRLGTADLSGSTAWLGIICYSIQIYFDFSGYSDMAIGLGRMFGFDIPENFNWPYIAENFTDFWRRWHISLSRWMKEYLYIPLGGNRISEGRTYLNLWVVFLLSGLWHGASWNFLAWGAFHGCFLALDKAFWLQHQSIVPRAGRIFLTYILVLIGWVFFRAENLTEAVSYIACMFGATPFFSTSPEFFRADIIHNRALAVLLVSFPCMFIPAFWRVRESSQPSGDALHLGRELALGTTAIVCLFLSVCALATADFTPFLYFRF